MRTGDVLARTAVCAIALMMTNALHAQTVQKCRLRDGNVRYQSEPCGVGERVLGTWDATPDPDPPPQSRTTTRSYAATSYARNRRPRRNRVTLYRNEVATADPCSAARAYRDTEERRAGLARNYDLLSALQQRVFEACR